MNRYRSGADFERRICKHLTDYGALCVRAAGSHGVADVVALWPNRSTWIIQAKKNRRISREETRMLDQKANEFHVVPIMASALERGRIKYERHHSFANSGYQWSEVEP